jgi:hypothetical protein
MRWSKLSSDRVIAIDRARHQAHDLPVTAANP